VRKLRVGVSIFVSEDANIWSNGINQNIALLAQLLKNIDFVDKVYFLNGGSAANFPSGLKFDHLDVPLVQPSDVTYDIDVVIEMGARLPMGWKRRVLALGGKSVLFIVGHSYSGLVESVLFGSRYASLEDSHSYSDVWGLPHHRKTGSPLLETICRRPVWDMPHLWSPIFLKPGIAEMSRAGKLFGFQPSRSGSRNRAWRVGIFEPNLSVVKNCLVPMLICESAYRKNKEAIGEMMVMGVASIKEKQEFKDFARGLSMTRDERATYNPRMPFVECMARHGIDAVVSHQWECALNYAYYDALHGGYPLIHNSEILRDAGLGFFYSGSSASAGAEALLEAWDCAPELREESQRRAAEYLRKLAPDDPNNIQTFAERLLAITAE
jgi:hypothetical protein